MTVRLHIERLLVDRELAGSTDPRDLRNALQAALTSSLSGPAPTAHARHERGRHGDGRLELGGHGALAERLADTLHAGIPALQSAATARTGNAS